MRLGALLGPITKAEDHGFLAEQARRFEQAGYETLWSAQAIGRGFMITDPLVALAAAAVATEKVEVGTAILQVPLYHPVDLAHRVLSLQQIAGERLIFGVGAGSTEADFLAFEQPYDARFRTFNASLERLRQLFATGTDANRALSPWPAVEGGPPIFYGTWGNGVARAAREFDGWIASGAYRSVDEVCEAYGRFAAAGGGRAIVSTLQLSAETDLGEFRERLKRFAETGFDDAVVMFMPGGPDAETVRGLI